MYTDAVKAGSDEGGDHRGSGYTGRGAAPPVAAHPDIEVVVTAHAHAGQAVGSTPRRWLPPIPALVYRRPTRSPTGRPRPGLLRPSPRASRSGSSPSCGTGSGWSSTWRPTSGCAIPPCTRPGTGRSTSLPTLLGAGRLRPARAVPRPSSAEPRSIAVRRLLPDGGRAWPWPRCCRAGLDRGRPPAAHRRRGQRRLRGRAGAQGRACTSARSTRTSSPTDCSTTATPPEMEQILGCRGAVHAPPGPDGAGDPGHLLRPPGRRRRGTADHRRRHGHPARRPTTTSRSWWSPTSPPSTKATSRVELRPRHGPGRPAHGLGAGPVRHRQSDQGGIGPGRPVRQPGPRPPRGHRTAARRGRTREHHRPGGVRGRRRSAGHQGRRARSTSPWWPPTTAVAVPTAGHLHHQPGGRRSGPGQPRPSGGQRRAGRPGWSSAVGQRQRGHRRAAGRADAATMCRLTASGLGVASPTRSWSAPPGSSASRSPCDRSVEAAHPAGWSAARADRPEAAAMPRPGPS